MNDERILFRSNLRKALERPNLVVDRKGTLSPLIMLTEPFGEFQREHFPTPDLWVMEVVLSICRRWRVYRHYIDAYRQRIPVIQRPPSTIRDLLDIMDPAMQGSGNEKPRQLAWSAEFWTPANASRPVAEWKKVRVLFDWIRKLVSRGISSISELETWARSFDIGTAMGDLKVSGIGARSFFYLRMLALGDGIKPDRHVLAVVRQLLHEPAERKPSGELVEDIEHVAREIGTTAVLLDNSMWAAMAGIYPDDVKHGACAAARCGALIDAA